MSEIEGGLFRLLVQLVQFFKHCFNQRIPISRDPQLSKDNLPSSVPQKSPKEAKDSVRSELRECQVALGLEIPRDMSTGSCPFSSMLLRKASLSGRGPDFVV